MHWASTTSRWCFCLLNDRPLTRFYLFSDSSFFLIPSVPLVVNIAFILDVSWSMARVGPAMTPSISNTA